MREVPVHIGFIMDGNGRWAKKRLLPRTAGHLAGLKALKKVALGCIEEGVGYITLYCFSTENWKRPKDEVDYLMGLFSEKLMGEMPFFNEHGIRLLALGDMSVLPPEARAALMAAIEATKDNTAITAQLAINYGGQSEICQAVERAVAQGITKFTPEVIRAHFDNPEVPPCDVIARSAGERRLSNFLLFDSAYAEFMFYDRLWPDWCEDDVRTVIDEYNTRVRRFGGLA